MIEEEGRGPYIYDREGGGQMVENHVYDREGGRQREICMIGRGGRAEPGIVSTTYDRCLNDREGYL